MSYVKHLVSKKKKRYMEDGFDLDLAYIKPNIVAMGFPSENLEGVYRNNFDDVVKCSEREYDPEKFRNRVCKYPFDDHNAPPFELIEPCCKDMAEWIDKDKENVAIIHCKAGKGRTGVMICSYLLYTNFFQYAEDSMNFYADARTSNNKGVTIPSQRRYITYFGYYVRHGLNYTPKTVLLKSVTFVGIPSFNSGTCSPSFIIYQTKVVLFKSKSYEVKKSDEELRMDLHKPLPICGDIKIDVFHKDIFKKERMFVFWFNTFFLEHGVTLKNPDGGGTKTVQKSSQEEARYYELRKFELDKANKDKKHKFFPENFMVRLHISIPNEKDAIVIMPKSLNGLQHSTNSLDSKTKTLKEMSDEVDSKQHKAMSLPRRDNLKPLDCVSGGESLTSAPSSPSTKRLQQSVSSPLSPVAQTSGVFCDRSISRSLEVLRVEDEPLSDDDEDDDQSTSFSYPITRV